MLRKHGLRSFFVGLLPTVCREMPGYFFFFGAYEMSRSYFTRTGQAKEDIGMFLILVCNCLHFIRMRFFLRIF